MTWWQRIPPVHSYSLPLFSSAMTRSRLLIAINQSSPLRFIYATCQTIGNRRTSILTSNQWSHRFRSLYQSTAY